MGKTNNGLREGGVATFGGYDLNQAKQYGNKTIYWNELVSMHYWTINLGKIFQA
jgi:hypothetical protein